MLLLLAFSRVVSSFVREIPQTMAALNTTAVCFVPLSLLNLVLYQLMREFVVRISLNIRYKSNYCHMRNISIASLRIRGSLFNCHERSR